MFEQGTGDISEERGGVTCSLNLIEMAPPRASEKSP